MDPTGTHILAEYSGCDRALLDDPCAVEQLLVDAAAAAGATVVARQSHRVESGGVICVVVLQESHMSLHTWPYEGYAAADFFTCGTCDPRHAHPVIEKGLVAETSRVIVLQRGLPTVPRMRVLGHRAIKRMSVTDA